MNLSITGYTKAQQDALLAGKVDAPTPGAGQGYVPTVNAEGGHHLRTPGYLTTNAGAVAP